MLYPAELRARTAAGDPTAGNLTSSKGEHCFAYIRPMPELITHKADPLCPMTGPHDPALCGLVAARHRRSAEMNAAIDRQEREEQERQARRL
jgi:hypothetical protein